MTSALRELTIDELEMVSGGVAPGCSYTSTTTTTTKPDGSTTTTTTTTYECHL